MLGVNVLVEHVVVETEFAQVVCKRVGCEQVVY